MPNVQNWADTIRSVSAHRGFLAVAQREHLDAVKCYVRDLSNENVDTRIVIQEGMAPQRHPR